MKNSKTVVEKRRNRILELIDKVGDVKVTDIAQVVQVSEITVRRDLQYLEDKKIIQRYYGGARVNRQFNLNISDEKDIFRERIAMYAASLINDGDSIFINASDTALAIIKHIKSKNVTIITNNGNAVNIRKPSTVTVILTGGELRHIKGTMVGEFTLDSINKVTAKKSFLGCSGLSIENGMTTEVLNEVKINQAMFERVTEQAYILADHTKIGVNSSFSSICLKSIQNIITDEKANNEIVEIFLEKGIKVHKVSLEEK